ncbi:hypothetical protein BJ138DRAFT_1103027 [Hygrophoropsis aurantiaca]|uniref:Uncharacterized protein n=1 Tax=Hygrophoropsis aurantiaca TaxID=72124 RepID=A0ACB8A6Q1_9AGAM|nr:hypothetical protein BJ138DRAFT_1103027 [Hygrophoropsis aurantiaca]
MIAGYRACKFDAVAVACADARAGGGRRYAQHGRAVRDGRGRGCKRGAGRLGCEGGGGGGRHVFVVAPDEEEDAEGVRETVHGAGEDDRRSRARALQDLWRLALGVGDGEVPVERKRWRGCGGGTDGGCDGYVFERLGQICAPCRWQTPCTETETKVQTCGATDIINGTTRTQATRRSMMFYTSVYLTTSRAIDKSLNPDTSTPASRVDYYQCTCVRKMIVDQPPSARHEPKPPQGVSVSQLMSGRYIDVQVVRWNLNALPLSNTNGTIKLETATTSRSNVAHTSANVNRNGPKTSKWSPPPSAWRRSGNPILNHDVNSNPRTSMWQRDASIRLKRCVEYDNDELEVDLA